MQHPRLLPLYHGETQCEVVVIVNICCFDWFCRTTASRTLGGSFVNEVYCYCPGGCSGNIWYIFPYNDCHILVYGCLWSSAIDITEEATVKIIDALLMLIFMMGYRACRFLYCLKRRPILFFRLRATCIPADYP
jgi:hypothetical protein